MIAALLDTPWGAIGVGAGLLFLLVALSFCARKDGYADGQLDEAMRQHAERKRDYERGRVDGIRETVEHLRATGGLRDFPATATQDSNAQR